MVFGLVMNGGYAGENFRIEMSSLGNSIMNQSKGVGFQKWN